MAVTLDGALKREISRRDHALGSMRDSITDTGEGLKAQVAQIGESLSLEHILAKHPWASVGAALGAGLLASRILIPGKSSSAATEPQRVVVEVRHMADGQVEVKAVEAPRKGPMDYLTKAMAAFQTVQGVMQQINIAKAQAAAEEPPQADPEPATTL